MEVFMKNNFAAYETLMGAAFRFDEESNGILTLKIDGISRGKHKQIQINFTKRDFHEIEGLKEFVDDVVKHWEVKEPQDREEA